MRHCQSVHATVILTFVFAMGCASPSPLPKADWIIVKSPNFEILSTMRTEEATALSEQLEQFRALIFAITNAPDVDAPVPTRIIAFARKREFRPFSTSSNVAGFFAAGLRANYVVFADWSSRLGATEIIYHEYVHFILRNRTSIRYPMWYDEGFAEVLSTVREHKGKLVIGALPKSRIASFRYGKWLPMRRIIESTNYDQLRGQDLGMFYAQAWALAHYAALDHGNQTSISEYIELLARGQSPTAAYEYAYGETISESSAKIRRKLAKGDWRLLGLSLERLQYDRTPPSLRTPSEAEVSLRLGQLQIWNGKGAEAQRLFDLALQLDPHDARAHAGMGDALKFQDMFEEAGPYFQRAVELEPGDALNHLDLAEYLHDLAEKEPKGDKRKSHFQEARAAYRASQDIDSSIPESHLMYGRTFLAPGEDPSKGLPSILRAYELVSAHRMAAASLAEAYVATGQEALAKDVIRRSTRVGHNQSVFESVAHAISDIRERRKKAAEDFKGSDVKNR